MYLFTEHLYSPVVGTNFIYWAPLHLKMEREPTFATLVHIFIQTMDSLQGKYSHKTW